MEIIQIASGEEITNIHENFILILGSGKCECCLNAKQHFMDEHKLYFDATNRVKFYFLDVEKMNPAELGSVADLVFTAEKYPVFCFFSRGGCYLKYVGFTNKTKNRILDFCKKK